MAEEVKRKRGHPPGKMGTYGMFPCPRCGGKLRQYSGNMVRDSVRGPLLLRWRRCRDCGMEARTREVLMHTSQDADIAKSAFGLVSTLLQQIGQTEEEFDHKWKEGEEDDRR